MPTTRLSQASHYVWLLDGCVQVVEDELIESDPGGLPRRMRRHQRITARTVHEEA